MRLLVITVLSISFVSSMSGAVFGQDMESMFKELQALKDRLDTQDEEIRYLRLKVAKEELTKIEKPGLEGKENPREVPQMQEKVAHLEEKVNFLEEFHKKTFSWKEKPEPFIKVGRGRLNIGGLFQGWFSHDELAKDEFRIRRTEIKLYGEILPKFKYTVMFDPAKRFPRRASDGSRLRDDVDSSGVLQDAYVNLGYLPHHELTIGQFKIPIIEEGLRSSSKLDFVERSIVSRTFSDRRDIGLMLKGDYGIVEYYLALVNGEETNAKDLNDRKDYMGRLVLKPFKTREESPLKSLEFGGSYYNGKRGEHETMRTLWAAEARYHWNKLALKAEYATGRDDDSTLTTLRSIHKDGWYAQAGYRFFKPFEGVVRYEEFRPDRELKGNEQRAWTLGLNWFFDEHHAKLQLNYIRNLEEGPDVANDQILSAIQVAF